MTPMRKILHLPTLALLGSLFCSLPLAAQGDYPVSFDKNTDRTHASRMLNSITLNGNTFNVKNNKKMYHDLTDCTFRAHAGELVSPSLAFTGRWMDSYIYIDKDGNGQFDVQTPGEHGSLQADNDLVSFSGMTLADGCYDSAGEVTDLSLVQSPAFMLPADMLPGTYRMRVKIDWDSADPAGRADEANGIIKNGGAIADLLLEILPAGQPNDDGDYVLLFHDEFNQPDGSQPDETYWRRSTRRKSVWNRFISDSEDVVFIQDGHLVCRAIANPDTESDPVEMLTGSIETQGKFSFTYGRAEARLKTLPHKGNFPAFWMMPQPPTQTWPNGGEIDIFEAIDAQNTAFHTLHSHWINDLGNKTNPKNSFSETVTQGEWHLFAVDWTEDLITFFVDGNPVGSYAKSEDETVLDQGQWPYTHPFYLILNQSVGDGSWAKAPDLEFTYETRFDWVRVFQKQGYTTGIEPIRQLDNLRLDNCVYDLSGRKIATLAPRNSNLDTLPKGIYIINGHKVVIK